MNGAGRKLFSGASLPGDEYGSWRRRGAPNQGFHLLHRRAVANEIVQGFAGPNVALQQINLSRELPAICRSPHAHQQLIPEERLLHKIDRTELHRLDRGVERAKAGHDHEYGVDAIVAKLAQHVDAGKAGHPHVGKNDVERSAPRKGEALLAAADRTDCVSSGTQHPLDALSHRRVVVNDENPRHQAPSCKVSADQLCALSLIRRHTDTSEWEQQVSLYKRRERRERALARLILAIAVLCASCSAPPTRATLPSARSPEPATIRVGVREGNRITIRKVPFETYVQAAILSEFAPPNGDPDVVERMLEVQAVIGRTYALAHLNRHASEGFDVCATTHCQLFEPSRLTTSRWAAQSSDAVRQTTGTVVWFRDRPADALFHADCGGHTSRADDVWTGIGQPYLVSLEDDGPAASAHATWRYETSEASMVAALNK